MRTYPFDVRDALLKSAKTEFLKCGFEKASLRTICRNAGVTTGAFYSYFERKEELFTAIVEPTLKEFYENCRSILALQEQRHDTDGDSELQSVEFMMAHRDEFVLLFDCAGGTQYQDFQEEVLNGPILQSYQRQFDFHAGRAVDPALVSILLRMKFEEYRQLLYGNYPMEEARGLVRHLTSFSEAGFLRLMKELRGSAE